jgi:hypothetical protein
MSPEVFDLIPVLVMQADSMPNLETRTHLGHPNDIDRCRWCARTDKRDHLEPVGLCPHHFTPPQTGSTTQKLFAKTWDKEQREQRIPLTVNDKRVQSRAHIKVLGRLQRGDGDDEMDILARIGRARNTVQQLHNVWDSPRLTPHQKHRLYFSLAATIVIYGCEMWDITPDIAKTINRFNTRTLERVNQRAYGTQAHKPIEWDLLGYIHYRRLIFAGHLFRAEPSPTGPTPTDTPHTSFRFIAAYARQASPHVPTHPQRGHTALRPNHISRRGGEPPLGRLPNQRRRNLHHRHHNRIPPPRCNVRTTHGTNETQRPEG